MNGIPPEDAQFLQTRQLEVIDIARTFGVPPHVLRAADPILSRHDDLGMAEAFGRDPQLEEMVRDAVRLNGIYSVIETGTWRGYTTRRFSEFVPSVHAIELQTDFFEQTRATVRDRSNVTVHQGDSASELARVIPRVHRPVLYYLDAHWGEEWPLIDELRAIARLDDRCVIVVHDAQVPGTDLGYDSYGGTALTLDFLMPALKELRFAWRHYFNDETAQGHRRGALFIVPCDD